MTNKTNSSNKICKYDDIIISIIMIPVVIISGIFLVFFILPLGGLFSLIDKILGIKGQPLEEEEYYKSGGRGTLF